MSDNKTDIRKTGRNKPCPCGSDKKFKKCHLDEYKAQIVTHETPDQKKIFELLEQVKSEFKVKKCMHPASLECTSIIAAHTIQMNGTLDKISKNYHLLRVSQKPKDFGNDFEKISSKKASTFYGFCEKHDSIFHIFENKDYDIHSIEQAFYIAYRTICMELYNKEAQLETFSKHKLCIKKIMNSKEYKIRKKGSEKGLKDLEKVKDIYDKAILNKSFEGFSYKAFVFDGDLHFCSAGFCTTDYTFQGFPIPNFNFPEGISISLINIKTVNNIDKIVFLIHWPTSFKSAEICAKSLLSISDKDKPLAILNFMLLNIENCFFSADWIDSLDDSQKNYILELSQNYSHSKTLPTTIPKFNLDWKILGIHNSN